MTNLKNFLNVTGLSEDNFRGLFKKINEIIEQGATYANMTFNKDPEQFDFRGAKAIFLNSSVKKLLRRSIYEKDDLQKNVKHIRSHGVDYFLVNGKFLLCIKKMDKKGRVTSIYSKRFKQTIMGGKVDYSSKMLNLLSEMGIKKPLPILFAGYVLDKIGQIENVLLVNYKNLAVEHSISLKELYEVNLFSSEIENDTNVEVMVKVKTNKKGKIAINQ